MAPKFERLGLRLARTPPTPDLVDAVIAAAALKPKDVPNELSRSGANQLTRGSQLFRSVRVQTETPRASAGAPPLRDSRHAQPTLVRMSLASQSTIRLPWGSDSTVVPLVFAADVARVAAALLVAPRTRAVPAQTRLPFGQFHFGTIRKGCSSASVVAFEFCIATREPNSACERSASRKG